METSTDQRDFRLASVSMNLFRGMDIRADAFAVNLSRSILVLRSSWTVLGDAWNRRSGKKTNFQVGRDRSGQREHCVCTRTGACENTLSRWNTRPAGSSGACTLNHRLRARRIDRARLFSLASNRSPDYRNLGRNELSRKIVNRFRRLTVLPSVD